MMQDYDGWLDFVVTGSMEVGAWCVRNFVPLLLVAVLLTLWLR